MGEKAFYTDEEVAAKVRAAEEERGGGAQYGSIGGGLTGFVRGFPAGADAQRPVSDEPIQISPQTSAVIDPPNGRLPPWTPAQVTRYEAREAVRAQRGEDDSWLD